MRFREEPVAFMGDIEAMFYQVRIPKDQRDFVRFLWWPDGDLSQDLAEYEMTVHIFGAVSSPSCSNFGLRRAADDYECKIGTESADVLRKTSMLMTASDRTRRCMLLSNECTML